MGGSNETLINGLRLHVSGGEVHIHNDKSHDKFSLEEDMFKSEVKSALNTLKKRDGVSCIPGTGSQALYIMKNDGVYNLFVGGKSIKKDLESFIRTI